MATNFTNRHADISHMSIDERSFYANAVLLSLNFLFASVANPLVILTIGMTKSLRRLGTNKLIMNLSVANTMSSFVDFLLVMIILWGSFTQTSIGAGICTMEIFSNTFLTILQFNSIIAISYER